MAWFAYIGRAGSALDGIRALCTSVQPNKTTTGTSETDYHGGGGGDRIQRTCPANSVVTAMRVWMGNDRLVSKFDLTCTNLQDGSTSVQGGRTGGRPIEPSVLFSCNPDEVGVGIYGRSGAMIDNIGLICEKLAVVQPGTVELPPPITDTTPACNSYADRMVAHANELIALKCDTQSLGAGLKTTNRDEYFRNCKSIGPDQTKYNENPVLDVLAKCKAGAGRQAGEGQLGHRPVRQPGAPEAGRSSQEAAPASLLLSRWLDRHDHRVPERYLVSCLGTES